MSIQQVAVTAGTSVDTVINPYDPAKRTTAITIKGRLTGTVQIKFIARSGDTYQAPSGSSSIDLTATDTLIIENNAVTAVRIDDTANSGAALSATIETY
jgi:hypothetical protein